MDVLLNSGDKIYYVVKVKGQVASPLFETQAAAEHYKLSMPERRQKEASVLPMTEDGKQLLLE